MKFKTAALPFAISAGLLALVGTVIWGAPQAFIKVGVMALVYASVLGGMAGVVQVTKKLPDWAVRDVMRAALILGGSFLVTTVCVSSLILRMAPPGQAVGLVMMMVVTLGCFAGMAGGAFRVLRSRRQLVRP